MSTIDISGYEMTTTRQGKMVIVAPAGKLSAGDIATRHDHRVMCMSSPADGWEPTGKVNGCGDPEYRSTRVVSYRITGVGKPFRRGARHLDAEDSRSIRADGRATTWAADTQDMQYAYVEVIA